MDGTANDPPAAGRGATRTLRMTVEYDGTGYLGWQTQPGGGTVQDTLEGCVSRILDHRLRVHGAGRTDRGVHARGQVGSFETANPISVGRMARGVNALLPPDIATRDWAEVATGFHARHSARRREYTYQIWRGEICSPFIHAYVYHRRRSLDIAAMRAAAARIVGRHDFTSFCTAESAGDKMERDVFQSDWEEDGSMLIYRVIAGSFLHRMVRNLVGTMVEIGSGRRSAPEIDTILAARDRRAAGQTAPARGLFLERVGYEEAPEGRDDAPGADREER